MQRTIIADEEQILGTDLTAIGTDAVAAISSIAGDALGWPHHWASVTVAEGSATTAVLTPGRLFIGDAVYALDSAATVDLTPRLPLVVGDTVYVALLLRGAVVTDQAQRIVLVDADTNTTDLETVDKTRRWEVAIVDQVGIAGPTPVKPTVAATECVVAWVMLASTGIQSIEMNTAHRVRTVYEIEGRVTVVEAGLADVVSKTSSIVTDIAALAAAQRLAPRPEIVEQMQMRIARSELKLEIPDAALSSGIDYGLTYDNWDTDHADALFRIEEGVRFQYAAIRDNQMALGLPADPLVKITGDLMLPAYTEEVIVELDGADGAEDISGIVHTEIEAVEHTISQQSISYGPIEQVCENAAEWSEVSTLHPGETFAVAGQTYQLVGETTNDANTIAGFDAEAWNADPQNEGHKNYMVEQLIVNSWTTTYTSYITHTYGLNGAVFGQTRLCSATRILTAIGLKFTRVGSTGDINLLFVECDATGRPRFSKVLGRATVSPTDLIAGAYNRLVFEKPVLIEAGHRYAWLVVTVGNHAIATISGNANANGSKFICTDGVWAQGDPTVDFCERWYGAVFAQTRTTVNFGTISLDGGIAALQMLYRGWTADAASIVWEFRKSGETTWNGLTPAASPLANPLSGLPPLVEVQGTFIGTRELQASMQLDSTARLAAMRPRGDFRAVSKLFSFGLSSSTIVMSTVWDAFDPARHTVANKIIVPDGSVVSPSATTVEIDAAKPSRRTIRSVFSLGAPVDGFRMRPEGASDSVVVEPFIERVFYHVL